MAFWENIDAQMRNTGFRPVNNKPNWYWRTENPDLYLVCLMDGGEGHFVAKLRKKEGTAKELKKMKTSMPHKAVTEFLKKSMLF